jgi:large subunit ribosomal protein L7/L12
MPQVEISEKGESIDMSNRIAGGVVMDATGEQQALEAEKNTVWRYGKTDFAHRGLGPLAVPDGYASLDSFATEYANMPLDKLVKLHALMSQRMGVPNGMEGYEQVVMQQLGSGGGGGGGGGVAVAAAPVAGAAVANAEAAEAEALAAAEEKKRKAAAQAKSSFDVKLGKYPAGNKIKLIKELRTVTNLPLGEAKAAIDKAPGIIASNISKNDAEKLKALFTTLEAEVDLI